MPIENADKGMEYYAFLDQSGYLTQGTWYWPERWSASHSGRHLPGPCWINMRVEQIEPTHYLPLKALNLPLPAESEE
jgi:hypothetical protein